MNQLLKVKVQLPDALRACIDQSPSLKKQLSNVLYCIEHGSMLSTALQRYPRVFDNIFVHYVRLGESTGRNYFEAIHTYLVFKQSIINRIKKALIYPAFVLLFLIILLWTLNCFLLPELIVFLKEQNKPITLSTQALMTCLKWGPYTVTVAVACVLVLIRSSALVLKIPYIGALLMTYYMALYYKSAALFLNEKVALSEALLWAAESINNLSLKSRLKESIKLLKQGRHVYEIMPTDQTFLKMVEEYGFLSEGLGTLSTMKMQLIENKVEIMLKALEPLLIIILGGLILLVVLAIWSPLYAVAV